MVKFWISKQIIALQLHFSYSTIWYEKIGNSLLESFRRLVVSIKYILVILMVRFTKIICKLVPKHNQVGTKINVSIKRVTLILILK